MNSIIYIGIDVHKNSYSYCAYEKEKDSFFAEHKSEAGSKNAINYIKSVIKTTGSDFPILIGYEAGPTGYKLCRDLQKAGFPCVVIAPSTIYKPNGPRIKTDRRDARLLAQTLAYKTFKQVVIPSEKIEAMKEFTRARCSKKRQLKKAKQELLSFLLRMGMIYPEKGSYWTQSHFEWLRTVQFKDKWLQLAFEEYFSEVNELMAKVARLDTQIKQMAENSEIKNDVEKLICFTGIDYLTAVSIVAEVGDFSRFSNAKAFSNYIGLCPGENSSGLRVRHTAITKAGNSRVRQLLIESAKSIKYGRLCSAKSKRLIQRQEGKSPLVIQYADMAIARIRHKMLSMERKGLHYNVITTAAARELSCFIWGMMTGNISRTSV
ncbi:MAG: IS110 family transposase [Spirochaetia bacterium]|nr:IS110 family transposase [Spirochaetia bacterium]MDD7698335.1 IS110 family transposase [Spirochaetia bacterium]